MRRLLLAMLCLAVAEDDDDDEPPSRPSGLRALPPPQSRPIKYVLSAVIKTMVHILAVHYIG